MKSFFENMVSQARAALDPQVEHERQQRRINPQPQPQPQQPQSQPPSIAPEQAKPQLPLVSPRLLQDSVVVLKEAKYASIDSRRAKALAEDTISLIELIFDHSRANDIELKNFLAAHGHLDSGETERQTKQAVVANTRWMKTADEMATVPSALSKANSELSRAMQLCQVRLNHSTECAQRRQAARQQAAHSQREYLERLNAQMFQQQRRAAEEHHLVMSNLFAKFGKSHEHLKLAATPNTAPAASPLATAASPVDPATPSTPISASTDTTTATDTTTSTDTATATDATPATATDATPVTPSDSAESADA